MSKNNPKSKRMGSDPLSWINDSRQPTATPAISKQSKHSNSELQSKPDNTRKHERPKSTRAGLKTGWTRATFIIREEHGDGIKSVAYWERKDIKDILDEALATFLKTKTIKPVPPRAEH